MTVSFGASAYDLLEGGTVELSVTLDRSSSDRLSLPILSGGSGVSVVSGVPETLEFAPGQTIAIFTLDGLEDFDTVDESLTLEFGLLPVDVTAGEFPGAVVSIMDNDSILDVCARTEEVQNAIIEAVNGLPGVRVESCTDVTEDHLGQIGFLSINGTEVVTLQFGDFSGLTSLQTLGININQNLTTLPSGLFADLGSLRVLDLFDNSLTTLPSDVFTGLGSLRVLHLDNNGLTTLPSDVFTGLDSLQELDLDNNGLTTLPSDVFTGLDSLQALDLFDNDLTTLPSDVFTGLDSLQALDLDNNGLATLPSDVFTGLDSLRELVLSNTSLTTLPSDVFTGLDSLQALDLDNNGLTTLPSDVFTGLVSLRELDLDNNGLTTLPLDAFTGLVSLRELDLSDNSLTSLPPGVISPELEARLGFGLRLNNNPWASPLSVSDERVFEDAGTASVTVELLRDLDYDLTLSVSTVDVTAESGSDYVALSSVLLGIGSEDAVTGAIVGTFDVGILPDSLLEGDETFELLFTNVPLIYDESADALVREFRSAVTILGPVPVSFVEPVYNVVAGGTVEVEVYLTSDPLRAVTVTLAVSSAESLVSLSSDTLEFIPGGVRTQSVTVTASAIGTSTLSFIDLHSDVTAGTHSTTVIDITSTERPVSDAGPDQTVMEGVLVTLDGSGSTDPEGTPLSYSWVQASGESVTLSDSTVSQPTFTSPVGLSRDAELSFSLAVTDDTGQTSAVSDTVLITVESSTPAVVVSFVSSDYAVSEGSSVEVFAVLDIAPRRTVSVNVLASGLGGATEDDYILSVTSLTFGPEEREATLAVTAVDDLADDDGERVFLELMLDSSSSNVSLGSPSTEEVLILDDEVLSVSFVEPIYNVVAGGTVDVEVSLTSDPPRAVTVTLAVSSAESIVSLSSDALEFIPGGVRTQSVTVTASSVGTSTLSFIDLPSGVTEGTPSTSVIDVSANERPVADAGPDQTVSEGVLVTLDGSGSTDSEGTDLSYSWVQSSGETVTLSDSTVAEPTFTSPVGLSRDAELSFSLVVTDDADQTSAVSDIVLITVEASNPSVVVSFVSDDYEVSEGSSVDVSIVLDVAPGRSVSVNVIASGLGGATEDDYILSFTSFTFGPEERKATLAVTAVDDLSDDDGESVSLELTLDSSTSSNVSLGPPSTEEVSLLDNDEPVEPPVEPLVTVSFGASTYELFEGGTIELSVTLDRSSSVRLSLPILSGGSGVSVVSGVPETLEFAPGQTIAIFTLGGLEDFDTFDESLTLEFGLLPVDVTAGEFTSAVVSIMDNDSILGVCSRTEEVQNAIIEAVNGLAGVTVENCTEVTEDHLGQIGSLSINGTDVMTLQLGDFSGLTSLQTLEIFGNQNLETLPQGLFADLGSLQELDLDNNGLTTLPSDVFTGLGELTTLDLGGNSLAVTTLPSDIFAGLNNLASLRLDNNGLTTLPSDVFTGLGSLAGLDLASNGLTTLPSDVFAGLGSLVGLDLASNSLTSLPPGVISPELEARLFFLSLDNNPWASPLSVSDARVSEAAGAVSITVNLLENLGYDLTLSVSTSDVSATSGSDYVALSNVLLTIGSDASMGTVAVSILPDSLPEGDETFELLFTNVPVIYDEFTDELVREVRSTVTISDPVFVSFGSDSYRVEEGASVTVTVILSGVPDREVTLDILSLGQGGAAEGVDYILPFGSVTIGSDVTIATFTLSASSDDDDDDGESVVLSFLDPLPTGISRVEPSTTEVSILDDAAAVNEQPVADAGPDQTVTEGVLVTLDGSGSTDPEGGALSYSWVQASGEAVTLSDSAIAEPTFTSPVDLSRDAELLFTLVVTDDTDQSSASDTVLITVEASTPAVVVSFVSDDYAVSEGSSVSVGIVLDMVPRRSVSVNVLASGLGGATEDDYILSFTSFTFGPEAREATLDVSAVEDSADEDGERVSLELTLDSPSSNVSLGSPSTEEVLLLDDEVTVSFGEPAYRIVEGQTLEVSVVLDVDPGRNLAITIVGSGVGTSAVVSGLPATVEFSPGVTEVSFSLSAIDDSADNDGGTLLLEFDELPLGVSVGTQSSALVSIIDNDPVLNVCDRTEEVQAAIITAANALPGVTVTGCEEITEAHLSGISGLFISNEPGLTRLQFGDFSGLTSLQTLSIFFNRNLTSLPSDVFTGLNNLERLDLGNNGLTSLPSGVFTDLGSLQTLRLDGNNGLTSLPLGVFTGLVSLRELDLSNNGLATLPSDVFTGLGNLTNLNLGRNSLVSLPPDVFTGLNNLTNLNLGRNSLVSLPPDVFSGLNNLEELNLLRNGLTSLPSGVFSGLGSLQELDLSNNGLTSLPLGVFTDLGSLQTLRLNDNGLTSLPPGLISAELEARLDILRLSNNPWTSPLSVSDERVFEDAGTASVTVELLRDLDYDLTLSVSTVDVTAESGSDYVALSSVLLGIGSEDAVTGAIVGTFDVGILPDSLLEGDETFELLFTNVPLIYDESTFTLVREFRSAVTILGPVPVSFVEPVYNVVAGETVEVEVSLNADPLRAVTVTLAVSSAESLVSLSSDTLEFIPGGVRTRSVTVTASVVGTSTLSFIDLHPDVTAGPHSTTVIDITSTERPVSDAGPDQTVAEGVFVTLDGSGSTDPEGGALSYSWVQSSGETVTLSDSAVAQPTFTSPVDLLTDAELSFTLVVTDDTGQTSAVSDTVLITVAASTPIVVVSFVSSDYAVSEGSSVEVLAVLDIAPRRSVSVNVLASGLGGATEDDYILSVTSFTFGPEAREATLDVSAVEDSADEDGESVSLALALDSSSSNVFLGSPSIEEVLLLDDEVTVSFGEPDYRIVEGQTLEVSVVLDADPGRNLAITIVGSGVGASAVVSGLPATVEFSPGVTEASFSLSAIDDSADNDGGHCFWSLMNCHRVYLPALNQVH